MIRCPFTDKPCHESCELYVSNEGCSFKVIAKCLSQLVFLKESFG